MSFILDSLRKSEHARQQSTGPSIADVRTSSERGQNQSMIFWLGGLVAINVLVLIVAIWRPWNQDEVPHVRTVQSPPAPVPERAIEPVPEPAQSKMPSQRHEVRSLAREVGKPAPAITTTQQSARNTNKESSQATASTPVAAPITKNPGEVLPTIHELQSNGQLGLADLHLDMHMYHDSPNKRFVFINSKKYKEGEKIDEGPLLEEIRNDSIVFYHEGQRFLLPRN